jgi:hypothetical protein
MWNGFTGLRIGSSLLAAVDTVVKHRILWKLENFLSGWATKAFSTAPFRGRSRLGDSHHYLRRDNFSVLTRTMSCTGEDQPWVILPVTSAQRQNITALLTPEIKWVCRAHCNDMLYSVFCKIIAIVRKLATKQNVAPGGPARQWSLCRQLSSVSWICQLRRTSSG